MIKLAAYARTLAGFVLEARSPLSFWRLLRIRLSQSKLGWLVCPSPITVKVNVRSMGLVELRSHTTDITVFDELVRGQQYGPALEYAHKVRVIVDLGANTGLAARWLLRRYPDARLAAVEPEAGNVAVLRRNLAGLDGTVIEACVGAQERRVALKGDRADGFRMVDDPEGAIRVVTMETVLMALGRDEVDLLKVDIEGAERELFDNCGSWIGRIRAAIVECHLPYTADDFLAALRRNGARISAEDAGPTQFGYQMVFVGLTP